MNYLIDSRKEDMKNLFFQIIFGFVLGFTILIILVLLVSIATTGDPIKIFSFF